MRNETFPTSYWLLLFLMFLIMGCNPVGRPTTILDSPTIEFSVSPTQFESDTPVPTLPPTSTPEPTLTLIPTLPPTQLPTSTLTPTITPTLIPIGVVSVESVNFREGPGNVYPIAFAVKLDTEVTILGQSEDGLWFYTEIENGQQGWVLAELIKMNDQIETLAVIEAPPTPLMPSATPTSSPYILISIYKWAVTKMIINLRDFPPNEICLIEIYRPDGNLVKNPFPVETNDKGKAGRLVDNVFKKDGVYTVIARCNNGSFAQTNFLKE